MTELAKMEDRENRVFGNRKDGAEKRHGRKAVLGYGIVRSGKNYDRKSVV